MNLRAERRAVMLTRRRMLRSSLVVFAALLLWVARPVRAAGELKLGSVELEGKLLDSKDRLLEAHLEAGRLRLRVEPMHVLRTIAIHGNPPLTLFDNGVQRNLSLRSG